MKINVVDPVGQTMLFSGVLILALLVSVRRMRDTSLFPVTVTQELKGFAILAIIFSHIGYFLANDTQFLFPLSILAGVGVNLFLFLSGLGLTVSELFKPLRVAQFYKRRLLKLFLPLWITLIILLALDWFFLHRSYPFPTVLESFLGIFTRAQIYEDINSPLWYFTLILFYYLIFPFIFWVGKTGKPVFKKIIFLSPLLVFGITYVVMKLPLPISLGIQDFYHVHSLAFPLGMAFAFIASKPINLRRWWRFPLIPVLVFIIIYTAFNSGVGDNKGVEQALSLITMGCVIFLFMLLDIRFKLLELFGVYSYEIYLLHWPLVYRYDFIYRFLPAWIATALYLGVFLGVGYLFQEGINRLLRLGDRFKKS